MIKERKKMTADKPFLTMACPYCGDAMALPRLGSALIGRSWEPDQDGSFHATLTCPNIECGAFIEMYVYPPELDDDEDKEDEEDLEDVFRSDVLDVLVGMDDLPDGPYWAWADELGG
jgi:hypothetical protein